jgi:small subunit ribosomal protein S23
MWLMKHQGLSKPEAYDQARGEFYRHRHLEALRLRIAKEEALHVGAYFAKGPNEIGMELEDKAFESWKAWAGQQIENETQMRAQMFSGPTAAEDTNEMDDNEYAEALQEVGDSVPKSREGQSALGGAAMHP